MTLLRNIAFVLVFYGVSIPIVLLAPLVAMAGRGAIMRYSMAWAAFHRWSAATLLGIRARYEGDPPTAPVLFAAKHQSMYETLELTLALDNPATVMKQELAAIPIWGWAARRYGVITVDRAASSAALRHLVRDAKAAIGGGRAVLLFPEGTRVAPGERAELRAGFAGLYKVLGVAVVPIATDSGRLWPRRGLKRAGTVTFRFGQPIPPGLPRAEAEARVHAAINALEA
ncbi:lysophospholipid acyltransferase family protein [uncultured Sphingomonas sp.]|uniref:lysophospholipid acyltransferase family protein n=1 Tax=uncultured Sphingomonas sp. TaxID=158754 RepID=UPI0035CB3F93